MYKFSENSITSEGEVPLCLAFILLVDADPELRSSRRGLLASVDHSIVAAASYADVCRLSHKSECRLAAIDLDPSEREAALIATHVRHTWPAARILLLGTPSAWFDDPLYDDSVVPSYNPAGVVEAAKRLLMS
jgi:hypothetical protein